MYVSKPGSLTGITDGDNSSGDENLVLILLLTLIPSILLVLFILVGVTFWRKYYYTKRFLPLFNTSGLSSTASTSRGGSGVGSGASDQNTSIITPIHPREEIPLIVDDSSQATTIKEMLENTCSGSGSGLPLLVQRSIARQIT